MKIITGATGETHVTSNNDGEFNSAIFGTGLVVLNLGNQFAYTIVDNNTITIADGDLVFQGRHALIEPDTTDTLTITTGTVDINRNDLIVAHYEIDTDTGYESLTLEVLTGTETSGTAEDPEYTEGDIRTGSTEAEVPLYRVRLEGISIAGVDTLFDVLEYDLPTLAEMVAEHDDALAVTRATLTAGDTEVTFTGLTLTEDSVIDFKASILGVYPTSATPDTSAGTLTVTFDAQDEDMEVGISIRE